MGERLGIHCLHSQPDDGAILDSLVSRSVESIASILDEDSEQYSAEDREATLQEVKKLASCLRSLVEIRLLSQTELAVQDLFARHPLYGALDPIVLKAEGGDGESPAPTLKEQRLTVLILGCGTYGTEALKAAFWLGRFAGTRLNIVVVEKDNVRQKMEKLFLDCPGMMCERSYSENLDGPLEGKWSIARRHKTPTVRFCQADVFSSKMRALLAGQKVHTMWYTANKDESPYIVVDTEVVLTDDDHLYCLVCLGDDDTGLNAALDLQRSLSKRKLRAWKEDGEQAPVACREGSIVPIAIRVRSAYALAAGQLGKNGLQGELWKLGFPLYPFGSLANTFTYASIASDRVEAQAVHINAAYAKACGGHPTLRKGRIDYNGLSEFHKLQNRAAALSIPYKLWMLGLKTGEVDPESFRRLLLGSGNDTDESRKRFARGLMMPVELNSGNTYEPSADEGRFSDAEDDGFRSQWPLLSYVADLEHVRWCALYRALGWRDTLSLLENDYADLTKEGLGSEPVVSTKDELKQIKDRIPLLKGTQHIDLKVHYYLCDNIDELGQRGKDCLKNPFAYDRMILWHSIDVLNGTACE